MTLEEGVRVESGSVIGACGVAWTWNEEETEKVIQPQIGGVHVGAHSFLGAHTVVVRGSINEKTSIGHHSLLAPGSRIGHGTQIGNFVHFENNVITGGNTRIADYCFIGSSAVFRPKVKLHGRRYDQPLGQHLELLQQYQWKSLLLNVTN